MKGSSQPLYKEIPLQRRLLLKKISLPTLFIAIATHIFSAFLLSQFAVLAEIDASISDTVILGWSVIVFGTIFAKVLWDYIFILSYRYETDGHNMIIRKGIFAKHEVTLPFAKITDVYVDRDLLDVVYCLWDLHISTPTAVSGAVAHIDGLSKEGCRRLREIILDGIHRHGESAPRAA